MKGETGWVSWLLSDKETYRFISGGKLRVLGHKAESAVKDCTSYPCLYKRLQFCCRRSPAGVLFGQIKLMSTVVKSGTAVAGVCLWIASGTGGIDEQETES